MSSGGPGVYADDRGVSEVIGPIILVGIVVAGALLAVWVGTSTIRDTQDRQEGEAADIVMQEVDSRLSTLATSSSATTVDFEFGAAVQNRPTLHTPSGYLNITVDERSSCRVSTPLDSIRVDKDSGGSVAYEAGGTWTRSETNGTAMLTAPEVSYRNGTVEAQILNLTGQVGPEVNTATLNVSGSRAATVNATQALRHGDCVRPDNVTVEITSDFHGAWASYLSDETGLAVDAATDPDHSRLETDDRTVTLFLNQSWLPRQTDDESNNVVNVTGADYMKSVSITDDGIAINKTVNNTYTVFASPLNEDIQIGSRREVVDADDVERPPVDVIFVVDESGSMGRDTAPGDSTPRYRSVRQAIRNFTTSLDPDMDRVGLAGFNQYHPNYGKLYRTNGDMLTSDFATFNSSTVDQTKHVGGTESPGGIKEAASLLDLRSSEQRNRIVVLLSDGENDNGEDWWVGNDYYSPGDGLNINGSTYNSDDAATIALAEKINRTDGTVYTVGFGKPGSEFDPDFLRDTALAGDGDYFGASNSAELEDAFSTIVKRITSTEQISRSPMSTNLSANGTVQPPQITGDTGRIGTATHKGKTFLNVNDPTAPATFSHSFAVNGGDMVNFSATMYGCDEWRGTGQVQTVNGTSLPVTRCADLNTSDTQTIEGDNVTVFTDDNTSTFNAFLNNESSAGWQTNMSQALDDAQGGELYNRSSGELTLESNQVLVLYDFPDGKNTDNRMLMLYTIGLSEESARPEGVIDIDINDVELSK